MSGNGNRLAELREARGWHRTKIAAAFENVREKTVYRWEAGEVAIPSDAIPVLAAMFEVAPEYLMGWDREPAATGKAA
jgi:transcriptional regulator with XRE-family HTH domain